MKSRSRVRRRNKPQTCFTRSNHSSSGFRQSHVRDGAALVRYFAWLEEQLEQGKELSESQVADQLEKYRSCVSALWIVRKQLTSRHIGRTRISWGCRSPQSQQLDQTAV